MHTRIKLNLANQIQIKKKVNTVPENTTIHKNVDEPELPELHDYIAFLENHSVLEERVEELSSKEL